MPLGSVTALWPTSHLLGHVPRAATLLLCLILRHQAKVLDRSARVGGLVADVRKELGEDAYVEAVKEARLMRNLLRVKVEDGNDIEMACATLDELCAFFGVLRRMAAELGEPEYSLFCRLE